MGELKSVKNNNIYIDNLYNDYNIKENDPIHKLNIHTDYVWCLTILNDER